MKRMAVLITLFLTNVYAGQNDIQERPTLVAEEHLVNGNWMRSHVNPDHVGNSMVTYTVYKLIYPKTNTTNKCDAPIVCTPTKAQREAQEKLDMEQKAKIEAFKIRVEEWRQECNRKIKKDN